MNKRHVWLMLACCLVPVAGLTAIFLFDVPVNTVVLIGLALFCPLSHLLLVKFMPHEHRMRGHGAHEIGTRTTASAPLPTEKL